MSAPTRTERKEATRQALMDAALRLSADTGLAGLSLRSVAKEVGIVPTAFYRHFASIEELGLALVSESFASLRRVLRDIRQDMDITRVIQDSVAILQRNVTERRGHFAFIGRERIGGLASVGAYGTLDFSNGAGPRRRPAPEVSHWTSEDLHVLANLIVKLMVETATDLVTLPPHRPDLEAEVRRIAERSCA